MAQTQLSEKVESFVKGQWADARARLRVVDAEIKAEAKRREKKVRGLWKSAMGQQTRKTVRRWVGALKDTRAQLIRAAGIAPASDVQALVTQVSKLNKKVDALGKRAAE